MTVQKMNIELPKKHIFKTPTYLQTDAYSAGSPEFQAPEAQDFSEYYGTYRRAPHAFKPELYQEGDERIIFAGLRVILEKLFYKPLTHESVDEMKPFMSTFKVTLNGLRPYPFPETLLRRVVDEFAGRPPIQVMALPEGSVVYPNEPFFLVRNTAKGFGELAAYFEEALLHVWGMSEAVTQGQHWLKYLKAEIKDCDPTLNDATVAFKASLMLTDMGARAAFNLTESEELGVAHLYTFPGTDTLSAAYQAFKDSGDKPVGNSVLALAHRNVQASATEKDCFERMFNIAEPGELLSMVNDAYASKRAVEEDQIPLAKRSAEEGKGVIIVSRADSGVAIEQIMQIINAAIAAGLYTTQERGGKQWIYPTTMHFIEADGMSYKVMKDIIAHLKSKNIAFYDWGLFGMGGSLRNDLKRDNLSAKFALSVSGDRSVVKFSDTLGKGTLPGPFKVCRDSYALEMKQTIQEPWQAGEDAMVEYFNGARIEKPFGPGQDDDFPTIKARIEEQMATMPLSLRTEENHGYPVTQSIRNKRLKLLAEYAPLKDASNY